MNIFCNWQGIYLMTAIVLSAATNAAVQESRNENAIKPYEINPRYWQYKGQPVMLLGGSNTDYIFLLDDLKEHLDKIAQVGGNYVRCTMSQREGLGMKPHLRRTNGKFDLKQWNADYWNPEEGGEDIACNVRYRPANSDEWKEAMSLWFDPRGPEEHSRMLPDRRNREPKPQRDYARQYRGSIVNLTPGTEYEIELSLQNTDIKRRINVNTWSEDFPVGKTIVLPETSDEAPVIEEPGSPSGYILYTGASGGTAIIDGRNEINHCIEVKASYVIIRCMRLKDPKSHAIRIYTGHDIVIEDCDISGWGLPGVDRE